jgi:lysine 2,3-aminomutase
MTISPSPLPLDFLHQHYPSATEQQWNDWHWQIKHSITSLEQLQKIIHLSDKEIQPISRLPIRITPYYASLMAKDNASQAIRRCVVPTADELMVSPGESADPLSEKHDSPVPNIVHRYPDRVLFLVTGFCSTYCRYCTRSHAVAKDQCHTHTSGWQQGFEYIKAHPQIRDVLISGGDALTMSDARIEFLLSNLRQIPHVEIIRIGTKVPAVLPQRITQTLLDVLKSYHPLWMSLHFTHPDEITPEVAQACTQLANAGVPLGSQTVLLKGINDEVTTMKNLVHALLKIRVRPYYLYQCDPILGSTHFRTPVTKGLEIIKGLRGFTSGYAIPHYVIDAPNGGGKIPLLPEYYIGREDNQVILENYEGKIFTYADSV